MSSRRAVGEDNILAMLERDSARRSGTRASNLRLACYGAAAAFAGILVGGVAWLAYDNHQSAEEWQAGHDALVAAPPAAIKAEALPRSAPPMLTAPPPVPVAAAAPPAANPSAAVIVDEPAPAMRSVGSAAPPLVMLPRNEATAAADAAKPAAPAPKPTPRPAKETTQETTKETTKQEEKGSAASAATTTVKPRPASTAARGGSEKKADRKVNKNANKNADKSADKTQRSAARAPTPAPQRSAAKAAKPAKAAAETARQRKAAAAEPQPDTDVALISAIISQSERHRGEREKAAACKGGKCPPGPTQP